MKAGDHVTHRNPVQRFTWDKRTGPLLGTVLKIKGSPNGIILAMVSWEDGPCGWSRVTNLKVVREG